MLKLATLFVVIFSLGEIALLLRRRSGQKNNQRDRSTLRVFWIILPLSITSAFQAQWLFPMWTLPQAESVWVFGAALAVLGLVLRWYAIYRLGRWFTVDVALSSEQVLLRDGPYRIIRHPSYTGALMTLMGVGVLLGNVSAIVLMVVPPLIVFLYRIHVEEQALSHAFRAPWSEYCAQSWRLIPQIY
nr:isoprenylcysteine carboxylmethyltransferase family protein [uncultured Neokomagataea sp.]